MDWLFVGDAHFASGDGERRAHFFRFIQNNKPTLNTLVIMGDFFDFWFGFRDLSLLKREYADILQFLKQLRSDGVRVIYLEGNHEFRLEPYMGEKLRIKVYERFAEIDFNGKKVYLAHGDRVYPTVSHRILTWFLRNWFTYQLISLLGPRIVIAIAKWWSAGSRSRNSYELVSQLRLRRFAQRKLYEGFDMVILAHTHFPEATAMKKKEGEGYYFNVGNWMRDFSYLRYNEKKGFTLEYYVKREKRGR
jgi:UDP-2,3-diacylglucosamine hydrolase